MEITEMVLSGFINKDIVAIASASSKGCGYFRRDANLIVATQGQEYV